MTGTQLSPRRILVVEDNSLNQLVAEAAVARLGFDVDVVANGREAVDAAAAGSYAVILMDCHMPVMDGFDATVAIRRRERGTRVPIIAMTAAAMTDDRERCIAAGMDDYIAKPVTLAELESTLARWTAIGPAPAPPGPTPGAAEASLDQHRLKELSKVGVGGGELVRRIVEGFNVSSAGSLNSIRIALINGTAEEMRRAAHQLRGAAANIGAQRAARLCRDLELGGYALPPAQRERLVDDLEEELVRVRRALSAAVLDSSGTGRVG